MSILKRWLMPSALLIATSVVSLLVGVLPANAAGFGFFQPFYSRTWCVNAEGILNGSQVNTVQCNGANDTQWTATLLIGGFYQIKDIEGKCLEDHNNGGQGTVLDTWTCNDSLSQDWALYNNGGPNIWHAGANYNLCMNLIANKGVNVWSCNWTNSQDEVGPPGA